MAPCSPPPSAPTKRPNSSSPMYDALTRAVAHHTGHPTPSGVIVDWSGDWWVIAWDRNRYYLEHHAGRLDCHDEWSHPTAALHAAANGGYWHTDKHGHTDWRTLDLTPIIPLDTRTPHN